MYYDGELTREKIAALGVDVLAALLHEQAAKDPALAARLRPMLAMPVLTEPRTVNHEPTMVGSSPAMKVLSASIAKIASTDAPVLITGKSGTGKELAAIAIHRRSMRSEGPFVPINCAALPKTLIASELFGYEKGAFTGADQRRIGRIQAADKGSLFLDELGALPMDMQANLLRFLQEHTIDRVGGTLPIKVDARVIAATNVPLRKAVAEGRFREDLFFRLNVLIIEMPPLRSRGPDIDILASHFVGKFSKESDKQSLGLSPEAVALLHSYPWPGNIRELIATMRRAVVMADGPWILPGDLGLSPMNLDFMNLKTMPEDPCPPTSLQAARKGIEASLIRQTLSNFRHNVKRSAEHLGVSRVTLYRLMDKHGIVSGE